MTSVQAGVIGRTIYEASTPVLEISGIGGRSWKRNVAPSDSRHGPWLPAEWRVLNQEIWRRRLPSLYLVAGLDLVIRYVGISRNRVADRWRLSPAVDAETGAALPAAQLFHSQCWRHLQRERLQYQVRCISGDELVLVLQALGPPVSGFATLEGESEGIAAAVERWLCNNHSPQLVSWNIAMTGAQRVSRREAVAFSKSA